jgi:hypothetical protein
MELSSFIGIFSARFQGFATFLRFLQVRKRKESSLGRGRGATIVLMRSKTIQRYVVSIEAKDVSSRSNSTACIPGRGVGFGWRLFWVSVGMIALMKLLA